MKILIVDDSKQKVDRLVDRLRQAGVSIAEILVAYSSIDARKCLLETTFDLMVLDIVLPRRAGEPGDVRNSLDLLDEIAEGDTYHRPSHILGLTAYPEAEFEAAPHFAGHLWSVIRYDETSNDWSDPIVNTVLYLKQQQENESIRYQTDLCVVTALREPEMEAVHRLNWKWNSAEPLDDTTFIRRGNFQTQSGEYAVATASAPRMGMVATALLCSKLIANLRPRFMVMTGVCAGVAGKTNIGDVIFADPAWDWQSGKRVRDKENVQFAISPHQLPVAQFVRARIEQLSADSALWNDIRMGWHVPSTNQPRLLPGPLASGSAVLGDGQVIAEIKDKHRNLLGVEMEAYGMYSAASMASYPRPTAFALKSVCDFADPDKKDDHQSYAAYTSAQTLKAFFERYMDDIHKFAGSA